MANTLPVFGEASPDLRKALREPLQQQQAGAAAEPAADPMAGDYAKPLPEDPDAMDYLQPQAAAEKLLAASAAVGQAQVCFSAACCLVTQLCLALTLKQQLACKPMSPCLASRRCGSAYGLPASTACI